MWLCLKPFQWSPWSRKLAARTGRRGSLPPGIAGDVLNAKSVVAPPQDRLRMRGSASRSRSEGCRNLEYLNLSWCDQITKDGVEALVRGCRGLKALLLRGCTQVPGSARPAMCSYPLSKARCGHLIGDLLRHFPWCPAAPSPGPTPLVSSAYPVRRRSSQTHSELLPRAREPQLTVLLGK